MPDTNKRKGTFVSVGNDIGIVVSLSGENNIPEEHLGVWYGETQEPNIPKIRTVPEEYCIPVKDFTTYH